MRVLAMNASSLYLVSAISRARRPLPAATSGASIASKNRRAKRLGLRIREKRRLVGQHLRVRAQIGGDDRPARSEVLIDLERRVRPGRSRRREDGRGVEVGGHFFGGPLAGEHDGVREAQRVDLALRAGHLRRLAADHDQPRVRPRAHDDGHRAVEQVQSLIVLERSGVEDDGRVCREPEPRANRVAPTRGRTSPDPGAFSINTVGTSASRVRTVVSRSWQITMTTRERRIMSFSNQTQHPREPRRLRVAEVGHLLRQARVHVVEMWHAEPPRQDHADDAAFLVRVDRVVLCA